MLIATPSNKNGGEGADIKVIHLLYALSIVSFDVQIYVCLLKSYWQIFENESVIEKSGKSLMRFYGHSPLKVL